jgi:hypothetical protein
MGVKIKFFVQLSVEAPNTNSSGNLFVVLEVKSVDGNKLFVYVCVVGFVQRMLDMKSILINVTFISDGRNNTSSSRHIYQ